MASSSSPRKIVPPSSDEEWRSKPKSLPSITRRAFFCGVVVETPAPGREYSDDVRKLVASLGVSLETKKPPPPLPTPSAERSEAGREPKRPRALTDSTALSDQIDEFVNTERSYVDNLHILKKYYADPLQQLAKSKDTAIIEPYHANTLFGNVDALIPVHEAFLEDLDKMIAETNGGRKEGSSVGGIGDVSLKHFKDYNGLQLYKLYYAGWEEAQGIFESEMTRRGSRLPAYIDRIKYSSANIKTRIGLQELLMDPVQRVPLYTLMFQNMIKQMAPDDPQREKLIEADKIARSIALAELDDNTKQESVMYAINSAIEDCPPALISNSRRFIECIDVEESYCPAGGSVDDIAGAGIEPLKCSLFLFDDKLMIVKGNADKPVGVLSGFNDLNKVLPTKSTSRPISLKNSGLQFKGLVEITDVVATDVGGSEFHLYLENPPQDLSERWSGRPFRAYTVVHPPSPPNLNPERAKSDKETFLEDLWTTQAKYRTKAKQSTVIRSEDQEVDSRPGRMTVASTYYNVYSRTEFLNEPRKTKVVVHIDADGVADPIPFGIGGPPLVVIRVQPMAGELSRFVVSSSDSSGEGEDDIIQTDRVPGRIVQTIHQYELFKFSSGNDSRPSTPTASMRSRAAIFGLDVIGQGVGFQGDLFGRVSSSRRTTSSRSSIYHADGSLARFSSSNSTTTAATTISDSESSLSRSRSTKQSSTQKLIKRKSPAPINPEDELPLLDHSRTRSEPARSPSVDLQLTDDEDEYRPGLSALDFDESAVSDDSEWALTQNLELAKRNSKIQSQPIARQRSFLEEPIEETIYEEELYSSPTLPSHHSYPAHPDRQLRDQSNRDYSSHLLSLQSLQFTDVIQRDQAQAMVLDNFLCTHGGYQHGNRNGCLKGTREYVLNEIRRWAKDFTKSPIFWLNGLAGTGKSAIAMTAAEWCDARRQLGSSFFCSHDASDHSDPCPIFPTLAIQLAQNHPQVRSILDSLLQSNPDVVYESASDQVEKLIVKPLKAADVPTLIIIDALDEWADDASQSDFLSALGHWIKEIPKVKFLVTSRPETHILASFHSPLLSGLTNVLALHDIAPHMAGDDIRLFFERELSGLATRNRLENWPTTAQLDLLCTRAAGLFVYAIATIKFLGSSNKPPGEQYAIIAHSPDDTIHEGTVEGAHGELTLDSLCISILQASFRDNDEEDDAIVCSILATVVLVTHPLPPSTIAALTGLEFREVMSILQSIRSLVKLDQHVCPFHKLLPDLLTSSTRCVDKRFYIHPGKFHSDIALNCLKLMNEVLDDSLPPQIEYQDGKTTLEYACTSWHVHLAEAREDFAALIPTLRRFLEEKVAGWLKVLGTPGALADPELALNNTVSWLREVAKDKQLLNIAEQCLLLIKSSL